MQTPRPSSERAASTVRNTVKPGDLAAAILRGRNADGGWGYAPRKSSRLEATAWALLALRGTGISAAALQDWPSANGLLLERTGGEPNYAFHALALLALQAHRAEHHVGNATLLDGLARVKGVALNVDSGGRQDNSLQGWSWIDGTFSWVEPTAWAMVCLKKIAGLREVGLQKVAKERVDVAERLLVNRVCVSGGWNYGNSDVLGQDLRPYVPTTAVALLAMQDRLTLPAITRSTDWLEQHATSERSAGALALALIALRVCGRPTEAARAALLEQLPITLELGNHASIALASYALGEKHDAFTI